MNSKKLSIVLLLLIMFAIPQWAKGQQYTPLTAKEAVERTDPVATQWAADAYLIFVGTGSEPGMYPDGKADFWACSYYSATMDSTRNFYATKIGPVSSEGTNKANYPSFNSIGKDWKDSDVVGRRTEQLGGSRFRLKHPDTIVGATINWSTIYEHTDHPRWGFWWSIVYWSAAEQNGIEFHFAARSLNPAPTYSITQSNPAQNQDIAFTTPGNDTLAVLNFSSGTLDSVKIERIDGYMPDTTNTENTMMQYYDITSYPENAPFEANLTLFYDQWRFDESGISDEAGLQLYRHNGQRWDLVGGTVDTVKNTVTATSITEFSKWTFANPDDQPLKIDEIAGQHPEDFVLWQNYPNPFNPTTTIQYNLPQKSHVSIKVFNLMGKEVQILVDEVKQPGVYRIKWNGKSRYGQAVASGLYVIRMVAGEFTKSKKIMLLK